MKPRGSGSVYLRGGVWWTKFYDRTGRARRESSGSKVKGDAAKLLRRRLGEVASGKRLIGADLERTAFEDLAAIIRDDYRAENRRSTHRLEIGLKRLSERFAGWRACDIDFAALQSYRLFRERKGAAAATVRWELGALRRAFRLAARAGNAECPQFPTVTVSNARKGFFEREEWEAIRTHLRLEFQDFGDFAFLTGWRTMEVLTLRWQQIDFDAGTIRLEPGTTKTGAGRMFPFADYPNLSEVIERRKARREEVQKAAHLIIPWVFFFQSRSRFHRAGDSLFRDGDDKRRRPSDALRIEWRTAANKANLLGRIPHDFRRTAARNMERAAVPRSVAMALGGWRSESMYRRYAIASEADLRDGVRRLSAYGRTGTISGTVGSFNERKSL
jgi:integrase